MIGWMIFLSVVILVLFVPCGIFACYNRDGATVKLIIGPMRINLLRQKKKKKTKSGTQKFESHEQIKAKKKISDFWPIVKQLFLFLADFRKKLKIRDLQLKVVLGGNDPYDLSLNYGKYWVALGNLMPHLESWFTIQKRNLEIECDFTATNTNVSGSIDLRLAFGTLLRIVLRHGIQILIQYFKISKDTKDGAVT